MRLIDADKIDFNEVFIGASDFAKDTRETAQSLIDAQPTIEAAQVVHGEWIRNVGGRLGEPAYYCSKCIEGESEYGIDNFCPNCGARMDGKIV